MASGAFRSLDQKTQSANKVAAKLPIPSEEATSNDSSPSIPQTLVRIPTEHAPALQAQTKGDAEEE